MPILWTLQFYIFREMGKTFLLAAVALTGVLGLGGGIMNMIELGEVTPGQLLRLMALVLPLAASLTLPVAALFSATSTYGRLSADNELVACRSSGINLHVLFLPTLALSLAAASVSFAVTNYVIPGMVRNLNEFIGDDFGAMIQQRLNKPRGFSLGNYRVHADECITDPDQSNLVILRGVAFVEADKESWVRYGTFRELQLYVDRASDPPRVTALALGVSWYDREANQFFENERQTISSSDVPAFVPSKIKFLNLGELLYYRVNPSAWVGVQEKMKQLRKAVGVKMVYDRLQSVWRGARTFELNDADTRYIVEAKHADLASLAGGLDLAGVEVEELPTQRHYRADVGVAKVVAGEEPEDAMIKLDLYQATVDAGGRSKTHAKVTIGPVPVDPSWVAQLGSMDDGELLESPRVHEDPLLAPALAMAMKARGDTVRRIVGAINERAAFSVSVFVLVILGAALGIVFRGSHVMTAFGVSFVPSVFVLVCIVTGKQMSHNAVTHGLGLAVMWGGIVAVGALDAWTLMRVVRR